MARALPSRPRPPAVELQAWGIEWHSRNRLDGDRRYLIWDRAAGDTGFFHLFRTRASCRAYIEEKYGYIRTRPDLQREPHGWRMPQAVKVQIRRRR